MTTTNPENNNEDNNNNKIDYVAIQTEVLTLLKDRIPYARPEEILSLMGSILTSVLCGTADMVKEHQNKFIDKTYFATTLLDMIANSVKLTIKSTYDMEKLV